MVQVRRVIVIGAGPAGLATAIALERAGVHAEVYERAEHSRSVGTGLTLWPNGLAALDTFGAGDAVRACALAADGIAMRAHTGRVLYEISGRALDSIGGRGVAVHRADLIAALTGPLAPDRVRFGMRCIGVRTEGGRALAEFADGSTAEADLVVGADGISSTVRSAAGLSAPPRFAGSTVWRAVIGFALPPAPGLLTFGRSSQFGIWRVPGDRVYWFASGPARRGRHRTGESRPAGMFERWHTPIPELLASTPTERITVTDLYDSAPLHSWSSGRVVLVGDAAHPSLPNMGQGTSQAFEDVAVLVDRLVHEPDIRSAFSAYEVRRRGRARAAWAQARALARIGGWNNPLACWLRERMLAVAPERAQLRQLERLFSFSV
ncbi:2-polyprenyl-6-methoxyphenol hydroxylase-like FAD-dependent oxidoreductase [Saccharomonospora amisosensis]|uniref:2-polyprenyl-6-methoxyphenol hydroxylase-like FAD-dependent oxidoreductase n=1 Tax=Saccharomonospora amisosensis TaxID=1128677 RepID=A0A7X5USH4_9PSEU|nr:FAD-dependent monooxygenase [Saccharomonospora amisosensis]NIJ13042.1 2-polyprenyl-6-methoxyphenol hydroxylase-like FAD-dependent oxidoreductase [Saccharomonospora amisosensis]